MLCGCWGQVWWSSGGQDGVCVALFQQHRICSHFLSHTRCQYQVTPTSEFQKDLGLDSLDTVELVMALEEEFAIEIPDSEADKILSCADAINYIASHPMAK